MLSVEEIYNSKLMDEFLERINNKTINDALNIKFDFCYKLITYCFNELKKEEK